MRTAARFILAMAAGAAAAVLIMGAVGLPVWPKFVIACGLACVGAAIAWSERR